MRYMGAGWITSGAVHVEAWRDPPDEQPHPGDAALIAGAVETRRAEFMTTRRCVRAALGLLDHDSRFAIRSGLYRESLWPAGIVGSLTHCPGYRAAAVARAGDFASIGIDAEPNAALPVEVLPLVAQTSELERAGTLFPEGSEFAADRLLFSAKEAIYKAWFPLTGRWLDFLDAEVDFDPVQQTFRPRISADAQHATSTPFLGHLHGSFLRVGNTLITGVHVPRLLVD